MLRSLRAALGLNAVLAVLLFAGTWAATAITSRWFEKDIAMRAETVVNGAEESLVSYWKASEPGGIARILERISRDERILAASACANDGHLVAKTSGFPPEFTCEGLLASADTATPEPGAARHFADKTRSGPVLISLVPVDDGKAKLGFVALIHDLTYVSRRESMFRRFAVLAFALLAASTTITLLVVQRSLFDRWTSDFRAMILGDERVEDPEFQPLLRDVQELVSRLQTDRVIEGGGAWGPERLKGILQETLEGEQVYVLANREPYIHHRDPDGGVRVLHPASGLVTALEPVMRACSGVWIAHGSGNADRENVDAKDRVSVPPEKPAYSLRRVWLNAEEEKGYYYGFSNEGLWPLCHIAHARPEFRAEDFQKYREVNKKFALAVCDEAKSEDPIILVQDYHFALAPRMIREYLPRATVLAFWHIPWPYAERFGMCPWREELLEGMLGASIVGFHTRQHANNFLESVDRFLEARIDRENDAVSFWKRQTLVRAYPISIAWPNPWLTEMPSISECRAAVRAQHDIADGVKIGVGVDRLDYTKGIEERFLAVERLMEKNPGMRGKFTFVQLGAPSRTQIPFYRDFDLRVTECAARINGRFGEERWKPIVLSVRHHEPPAVFRHLRAADVCYVSSLHDGMNLVAKEFVAARDDERGVLMLSEFTGASRELAEALIVNPYDIDAAAAALARAVEMPDDEQRARMRAMRALVAEYNVYRWAGKMLVDSARLRRRSRISRRFTQPRRGLRPVAN